MKGPYPGWDKDLHFVRSDDLWDSDHTKLIACGNQFEVIGQRVCCLPSSQCRAELAQHCVLRIATNGNCWPCSQHLHQESLGLHTYLMHSIAALSFTLIHSCP